MIKLKRAVIVEGRYDKIRLSSLLDAVIIETEGFRIFKDKEKLGMIRALAEQTGILILTDSDAAGFKIRRYLTGAIKDPEGTKIRHAYIPEILGKEKRKDHPSKEGTIGVEGMSTQVLTRALQQAGVLYDEAAVIGPKLTKMDLYEYGLSGGEQSARRRQRLLQALGMPKYITANQLVPVLNALYSPKEFCEVMEQLFPEGFEEKQNVMPG